MKKLTYIILGILIGALATYYFCPRTLEAQEEVAIVKPKGVITPAQAKVLNNNWTEYRKAAVDSAARKQGRDVDNRSTWWSLDDIENYIIYAKNQSNDLGYNMTGIRVYLGVYGKSAGDSEKGYSTMFIVPTGKKSRDEASSFNLFTLPSDGDVPEGDPLNGGSKGAPPGGGY